MAKNGTIAYVSELPKCNFPHDEPTEAEYDFKTKRGQWGFGCEEHFKSEALSQEFGIGRGQKLEVRS